MENTSPFIHQSKRVTRKASDVSVEDRRYKTQVKSNRNFTRKQLRLSSGLEILEKHYSLYSKKVFHPST